MTKKTVEIFVPDGYTAMASETSIGTSQPDCIITYLRKKPPRRHVFECASEEPRHAEIGEWYEDDYGKLNRAGYPTSRKYKIFKEIKE